MPTCDVNVVSRAINGIVAPSIMISASALMILALQGKYSHLTDRLRSLTDERRRLSHTPDQQRSAERTANVLAQIEIILLRAKLVRNSILSLYTAIAFFVLSSMVIGLGVVSRIGIPMEPALFVFLAGMVAVLAGTVYALRDIGRAYAVAEIEVHGVEQTSRLGVTD